MSRLVGKPTMWFPNRSDTNRPVQAQKRARSLKFRIYVEEELYYPSSENKGADQLRGYREADLRLCFRLCRLLVFPWVRSYVKTKVQISFAVTAKLISAFVFDMLIVQFVYFLNPKFPATSYLLCFYSSVGSDLYRNHIVGFLMMWLSNVLHRL